MLPADAKLYLDQVSPDEHVFILRSRDVHMPATMVCWAGMVSAPIDSRTSASEESTLKAKAALELAKEVREWQKQNPQLVKIPD